MRIPAASAITNCRRFEKEAQQATNTIGRKLMELGLQAFDTSGEPILVGQVNMTSKGPSPENYRTLFGPVLLDRHVYQTADGGKTFVTLEADARIISNSTPQLASCISNRYTEVCARKVERAFSESNQIQIDINLIQDLSRALGQVALAKEDYWSYRPDVTITLYNEKGEPLHTAYFAKAPQAGKEKFARQLAREVACYKSGIQRPCGWASVMAPRTCAPCLLPTANSWF